jgi:hypothetical protein
MIIEIEMDRGEQFRTVSRNLGAELAEMGYYHAARASYYWLERVPGGRLERFAALDLTDVRSEADEAYRYFTGQLRESETGLPVIECVTWDVALPQLEKDKT